MLMLTSSEFIALCRAQVVLLSQALGASLSVVYLTQELAEGAETQLIPVMAYPETAIDWQAHGAPRSLMSVIETDAPTPRLLADPHPSQANSLPASAAAMDLAPEAAAWLPADRTSQYAPDASHGDAAALMPERRVVLPLMHEEAVLGLLVTERSDRAWTAWEQTQIHQIAETLAIACVLDQRYQWFKQDHRQQQQLQEQQHERVDNLLHQFRNSLTALQTFGKLILKRLLPGDANRDIATSLVRETVRLRDLAQQLETITEIESESNTGRLYPLALPPALSEHDADDRPTHDRATHDRPISKTASSLQDAQAPPLLPAAGFLSGMPLSLEPCAIAAVLEPLLAAASAIAQERALTLLTAVSKDVPPVLANVQVLREVLSNPIDNALKYTPAGGQVAIEAHVSPDEPIVEIAISDTGPGIPAEDLPHIFERRYRGVQAQTDTPGSGLGLAIARALMTQMQGEIAVYSPARQTIAQQTAAALARSGQGTTVIVRLAIAPPSPAP